MQEINASIAFNPFMNTFVFVCCWFIKSPKNRHKRNRSSSITLNMMQKRRIKEKLPRFYVCPIKICHRIHFTYATIIRYMIHTHGTTLHGKSVSHFNEALKFVKHISRRIEKCFKKLATTRDACVHVCADEM